MSDPTVDVVIPVHTSLRPIARATGSVLATATANTRVTVVCHGVHQSPIADALGEWALDPRVRLLELSDGIPSAAGPINVGLDAATGEFTALLGSDDEYEPGAIDAWVAVARRDRADVVIPPLRAVSCGPTKSPPTRPFRRRRLDGVRDRLAYRTVQLGLVRRATFGHIRMTEGLRSGEDIIQGISLWYAHGSISRIIRGPGYLIHEDDPAQRASSRPKPASEALQFLEAVLAPEAGGMLRIDQRESFAIKLLRTTILDVLRASVHAGTLELDHRALVHAIGRIREFAPAAAAILSRREAGILERLAAGASGDELARELAALTDYRHLGRLLDNALPASLAHLLHREAPPRFLAATALMR